MMLVVGLLGGPLADALERRAESVAVLIVAESSQGRSEGDDRGEE